MTSVAEDVEKFEPSDTADENVNGAIDVEINLVAPK